MGENILLLRDDDAHVARVTIDMLPDVALIEIFDFYVRTWEGREKWYTLVHVCRKWRNVVFRSPLRLDLKLRCNAGTPVRETLNVWPPLPIIILEHGDKKWGVDNIVAALEHNDRICQLSHFNISSPQLEKVLAAMRQPSLALTHLDLWYKYTGPPPVIPTSFLGGSAPSLRSLRLSGIIFPGLPKLLMSTSQLVFLSLLNIPHSGYISPETIVTYLSMLTRLESLEIGFESPQSRPDRKTRLHPQTRTLLPVLTELGLTGVGDYLEDLVARIDAPLLDGLAITLSHQLILETPQLTEFISRTPKLKAHDEVRMVFSDEHVSVMTLDRKLELGILCAQSDRQLSSLERTFSSFFPQGFIPSVERIYILEEFVAPPRWQDDIGSNQWLEVFHPFTGVKSLYISWEFAPRIAPALGELFGERVAEVLPALETLFLETLLSEPVQEGIGQFVVARQLAGHPIAVSLWDGRCL